jgi:hypothetical protein
MSPLVEPESQEEPKDYKIQPVDFQMRKLRRGWGKPFAKDCGRTGLSGHVWLLSCTFNIRHETHFPWTEHLGKAKALVTLTF